MNYAEFGPAGNPDAFYAEGHKASLDMPAWLENQELNAYEYQCSRGVHLGEKTAMAIGEAARLHGIRLSIHAPYFISLATEDEVTAANTRQHFLKSLKAAVWMGADRVVFHIGGPGKQRRDDAFARARRLFASILEDAEKQGLLDEVSLAPETMGKQNQLGNLQEVLALCQMSKRLVPAVDFGHLHAVSGGGYVTREEYIDVFDQIAASLGEAVAARIHIHFSKIEFTKAGERRHWTFQDQYGPPYEPLMETIAERGYSPRVICESAGSQAVDAIVMQEYYRKRLAGK